MAQSGISFRSGIILDLLRLAVGLPVRASGERWDRVRDFMLPIRDFCPAFVQFEARRRNAITANIFDLSKGMLVGAAGFELATPSPPDRQSNLGILNDNRWLGPSVRNSS